MDRIRPRFEYERNIYYRNRYGELKRARLTLVAAKLALAFADADKLTGSELDETVRLALESQQRASDADAVMTALDRPLDLGYIWPAHGEPRDYVQPGIPSLMEFVARSKDMGIGADDA